MGVAKIYSKNLIGRRLAMRGNTALIVQSDLMTVPRIDMVELDVALVDFVDVSMLPCDAV